jgi:hypothetical protein
MGAVHTCGDLSRVTLRPNTLAAHADFTDSVFARQISYLEVLLWECVQISHSTVTYVRNIIIIKGLVTLRQHVKLQRLYSSMERN